MGDLRLGAGCPDCCQAGAGQVPDTCRTRARQVPGTVTNNEPPPQAIQPKELKLSGIRAYTNRRASTEPPYFDLPDHFFQSFSSASILTNIPPTTGRACM
jgi:hypothetical protein